MGLLDRIKQPFDSGGVKVKVRSPGTFVWDDSDIAADIIIENTADAERTITSIRLRLAEDEAPRSDSHPAGPSKRKNREIVNHVVEGSLTLPPGDERRMEVKIPLGVGNLAGQLHGDRQGWMGHLGKVVSAVTQAGSDAEWFELSVTLEVDGFSAKKTASTKVQNRRPGGSGNILGGLFGRG